jgi:UDP-N-acetylmuramoylalanine--D-glutamate ligase
LDIFVGGNIGRPAIELCTAGQHHTWAVLEVSSFQLATAPHFHPAAAAILNIEPDHLDWHPSLEDYFHSKWAIARNMKSRDSLILYAPLKSRQPADLSCAVLTFSESKAPGHAAYIHRGKLSWHLPDMALTIPIRHLNISHPPLLLDMLAAGLLAHVAGVPGEIIDESLRSFRSLPHRLQSIGTVGGIHFIDDSKATNVDAVKWALKSVEGPVVWLAGGLWKGGDLSVLFPEARAKVRALVAFGRDAALFESTFQTLTRTEKVSTLKEAVDMAFQLAEPGDTVLLSPACASFDQFQNYKERGKAFASCVAALVSKTHEEKTHAMA